jgi:hypothetical protein
MSKITRAVVALCLLPSIGCGVVFGGTRQSVRTMASPDGASVTTAPASVVYRTPTTLSLERKNEYVLTFAMDGYTSQQVQVERSMRTGVLIADILLTGIVGVVVDAVTGGWYKLSPEVATVTLTRVNANVVGPEVITVSLDTTSSEDGGTVDLRSTSHGVEVSIAGK